MDRSACSPSNGEKHCLHRNYYKSSISFCLISIYIIATISISSAKDQVLNKKTVMDSLDNLTNEQVIPDVIDSKPGESIKVEYADGVQVLQGNELKPTQVKDLPKFTFKAQSDKLYTLAMVDPDAPSRAEPKLREVLHYLVSNIPGSEVEKANTLVEYVGSGPPKGTGLHRYVFLLFEQKSGKLNSDMKIPKTSRVGRLSFSIRKFAKDNNLGEPIAANFYQAQYDDYVPTLHAQLSN